MRRWLVCVSAYCAYVRIMQTLPAYVCVRVCVRMCGRGCVCSAERTKPSAIFTLCRDYR